MTSGSDSIQAWNSKFLQQTSYTEVGTIINTEITEGKFRALVYAVECDLE